MGGTEVVELITHDASAMILPTLGGRLHSLVDRRSGREWPWRNPPLNIMYTLRGRNAPPMPYLLKLHAAVAVGEGDRLVLPGGTIEPVDQAGFSTIIRNDGRTSWPGDGDLSVCHPPESGLRDFVYVHDLPDGWGAVTDTRLGRTLRLRYRREDFPFCWLFITYGGWRDHQVVVLEPCTNHPKLLGEAIERGTTAWLQPGEVVTYEVTLSLEDA